MSFLKDYPVNEKNLNSENSKLTELFIYSGLIGNKIEDFNKIQIWEDTMRGKFHILINLI